MIDILHDLDALSQRGAGMLKDEALRCIAEKGSFTLAVSGGSTPARMFGLLAAPPFVEEIPWQKVDIFWALILYRGPYAWRKFNWA